MKGDKGDRIDVPEMTMEKSGNTTEMAGKGQENQVGAFLTRVRGKCSSHEGGIDRKKKGCRWV